MKNVINVNDIPDISKMDELFNLESNQYIKLLKVFNIYDKDSNPEEDEVFNGKIDDSYVISGIMYMQYNLNGEPSLFKLDKSIDSSKYTLVLREIELENPEAMGYRLHNNPEIKPVGIFLISTEDILLITNVTEEDDGIYLVKTYLDTKQHGLDTLYKVTSYNMEKWYRNNVAIYIEDSTEAMLAHAVLTSNLSFTVPVKHLADLIDEMIDMEHTIFIGKDLDKYSHMSHVLMYNDISTLIEDIKDMLEELEIPASLPRGITVLGEAFKNDRIRYTKLINKRLISGMYNDGGEFLRDLIHRGNHIFSIDELLEKELIEENLINKLLEELIIKAINRDGVMYIHTTILVDELVEYIANLPHREVIYKVVDEHNDKVTTIESSN